MTATYEVTVMFANLNISFVKINQIFNGNYVTVTCEVTVTYPSSKKIARAPHPEIIK
ncbi:MAG: hypothetical protein ONB16_11680 [candidate division KSB1 bacterium]|nr:hypothetical protein [candidate division KSB1 bacterium]